MSLIDDAMENVEDLAPLSPALVKKLHFAGKRKVPPSLKKWLAHDTSWLDLEIKRTGEIVSRPIAEVLDKRFKGMGPWTELSLLVPAPVVLLPGGSDSCRLLYLGKADAKGEYPVLVVDTDDSTYVTIESPSFEVFVAESFDALGGWERDTYESMFEHPTYKKAMKAAAKLNLHGLTGYDVQDPLPGKLGKKVAADKKKAAAKEAKGAKVTLTDEVKQSINALAKRRKKKPAECSIAALEIVQAATGRLDKQVAAAVAGYIKREKMLVEIDLMMLKDMPDTIMKKLRLKSR
jgi:hypothetical protein